MDIMHVVLSSSVDRARSIWGATRRRRYFKEKKEIPCRVQSELTCHRIEVTTDQFSKASNSAQHLYKRGLFACWHKHRLSSADECTSSTIAMVRPMTMDHLI